MRRFSIFGFFLALAWLGLACSVRAQETADAAMLQPHTKQTRYLSAEGFLRWQYSAQKGFFRREAQYMSPIGFARWQYFKEHNAWVGVVKAALLVEGQKQAALRKAEMLKFLGDTLKTAPILAQEDDRNPAPQP